MELKEYDSYLVLLCFGVDVYGSTSLESILLVVNTIYRDEKFLIPDFQKFCTGQC